NDYVGAIRYSITALKFDSEIHVKMGLDGDVKNYDSNYGEKFWNEEEHDFKDGIASMNFTTKKTLFKIGTSFSFQVFIDNRELEVPIRPVKKKKYIGYEFSLQLHAQQELVIHKFAAIVLVLENSQIENLSKKVLRNLNDFESLLTEHAAAWKNKWLD